MSSPDDCRATPAGSRSCCPTSPAGRRRLRARGRTAPARCTATGCWRAIERRRADGRSEGQVLEILERRSAEVVGQIRLEARRGAVVVPFDTRLDTDVQVGRGDTLSAADGDMVTVEIQRWPGPAGTAAGRVVEVLGRLDDPGVDTEIVLRKHGIRRRARPRRRRPGPRPRPRGQRRPISPAGPTSAAGTSSPSTASTPATSTTPSRSSGCANGHYWLGVHIADVAHYVPEGSALDLDGFARGTSVYFPERAVHMFPSELATGVCSLNPHVDRLVQSCLMEVDGRGEVVRYELHDGVIHSRARMTYTAVNAIVTDRDPALRAEYAALVPAFERMHALFEILNGRRRRRGSIDFDLPEAEVVVDDAGAIEAIVASERNVAHRIIEEFMLLANETVAAHLEREDMPALYRVHETPDPQRVEEFEEFVSSLGFSLAAPAGAVHPRHFQHLVERIHGTPEERPIAFLMLRTMQKARYDAANLGHFGLAAHTYTHFTSPIRRYPDLVVHRVLRELRHGAGHRPSGARSSRTRCRKSPATPRRWNGGRRRPSASCCSGRRCASWPTRSATCSPATSPAWRPFGLFVELVEHFVEGLVHVSTLADDYYRFDEQARVLFGERTKKIYRLGDAVRVQVVRVDLHRRQIELGIEEVLAAVRTRRAGPRPAAQHGARRAGRRRAPARRGAARPGRRERAGRKKR